MERDDVTHDAVIEKIRESVKNVRIAMLTTVDAESVPRSRPMAVQDVEFDGDLWFFTSDDSGKTADIAVDAQVNVAFVDPKANRYLSVTGRAQIVHDPAKIDEYWSPAFEIYFPEGKEDPHLALLRVNVESVAWWDGPATKLGQFVGFIKSLVKKDPSEMGEAGAVHV